MLKEVAEAFNRADFLNAVRLLDKNFGASTYSLKSLFRDEQRKIIVLILESALGEAEDAYRQLHSRYAPMMRFLKDSGVPLPRALSSATEIVLNADIRRALEEEDVEPELVENLLQEADLVGIPLQSDSLEYSFRKNIEKLMAQFLENPHEAWLFYRLRKTLGLLRILPFKVNLWKVQNLFNEVLQNIYPMYQKKAAQQDETAGQWIRQFINIGETLSMRIT
jgi:hypothetical protein